MSRIETDEMRNDYHDCPQGVFVAHSVSLLGVAAGQVGLFRSPPLVSAAQNRQLAECSVRYIVVKFDSQHSM